MSPDTLIDLDRAATLWINSLGSPASDPLWTLLSDTRVWFPAYAVVLYFLFRRLGWKRGLIALAALILTIVATDQFSNFVKDSVQRLRPCYDTAMLEGGLRWPVRRHSFYGFHSAHAANCFAFILCSLQEFRMDRGHSYSGYALGGILWASLVSLSRIMVGMHFLGDILAGALCGSIIGLMMAALATFITRKAGLSPS